MKKIVLSLAALSALAAGSPAAAQSASQNANQNGLGYGANAGGDFSARIEQLRLRIQTGTQSGAISRTEAPALRQQLRALTQLERQYRVNGLTGQERSTLQAQLRTLRQQVRAADGGGGYGQDGYGQTGNGRGGNVGFGQGQQVQIDRNGDGFDDRDLDRDGRWDDDERNRTGGTYDDDQYEDDYQQPAQRGGIGGLIDNVLGRNNTGTLRVGQRASSGLYALPSEYRNQYRDTNSAYFRTDGRQIYQIDTRTQAVVRIYAMNR